MSWADYGYPDNPDISTPYRALLPIWEAAVEREIILPYNYNLEVGCDIWTNERGKELWYPGIPIDNTEAFNTRYRISTDHMNSWLIRWATRIDDMMFQNHAGGAGDNIFGRFVRKDATKALNDDGTLNENALIRDLNDLEELLGEKVVMAYDYIGAASIVPWLLQRYRIFNELYIYRRSGTWMTGDYFSRTGDSRPSDGSSIAEAWDIATTGEWIEHTRPSRPTCYGWTAAGNDYFNASFSGNSIGYLTISEDAQRIIQFDVCLEPPTGYNYNQYTFWHPWLPEGVTRLQNPGITTDDYGNKIIDYNFCSKEIPPMPAPPSPPTTETGGIRHSYIGYRITESAYFYVPDFKYLSV